MATINFLYRSAREQASLNLRLLFTHNEKAFSIGGKTNLIVSKDYWTNNHNKKRINDIDLKNFQKETTDEIYKIEVYLIDSFNKADIEDIDKEWFTSQIENYYNPKQAIKIPKKLIPFFNYYLDVKSNELTKSRIQTIKAVQRKLERFEKSIGHSFTIIEVNDNFRKQFIDYSNKEQYSLSTLMRDVKLVKTICLFADYKDVPTHKELSNLKVEVNKDKEEAEELSQGIEEHYLSFEELEQIKAFDLSNNERLNNVRDWLLISCYTGQRISDFMRFKSSMIENKKSKYLLAFKQQKTGKSVIIPFLDEAREIVTNNNGEFPRAISHQKYNDYLKELCKLAGINKKIKGSITERISSLKKKTRNDYRRIKGTFEKWELVSSHIGRRSFATNFYGKVPTSVLIGITAHSTEQLFLIYIRKNETDTAIDAFKYFK